MSCFHGGAASSAAMPVTDFSANVSPLGVHPAAVAALAELASQPAVYSPLAAYPDSQCSELCRLLSSFWNFPGNQICCGAGAADLLYGIIPLLSSGSVIVVEPAFGEYRSALESCGIGTLSYVPFFLADTHNFAWTDESCTRLACMIRETKPSALFIASPSNPAGQILSADQLERIAACCTASGTFFILDACFSQFSAEAESAVRSVIARRNDFPCLVIINAFTKFYGMAGFRLGYGLCFLPDTADRLRSGMRPWPVSTDALAAAAAVIRSVSAGDTWADRIRATIGAGRLQLIKGLAASGCRCISGAANYILFKVPAASLDRIAEQSGSGDDIHAGILGCAVRKYGIAIRCCRDFPGLDASWYRVAVRTESDNTVLLSALASLLSGGSIVSCSSRVPSVRAVPLMIQGTMSNAGKSVIVAALCRIFHQDGYRVAPFKSQNMALNSGVTPDGLEMGRAQIMQAEAAGQLCDVRMNPVLLKPCGNTTSQVIVRGKVLRTMSASDYFSFRKELISPIRDCYERLAEENDIIVIEGAGSPAEINLKAHDIANMGMAAIADAPVLLAGDIDRGGVFASLYGTVALLEPGEQERIQGLIINKFRGDKTILEPGLRQLESLVHKPVLGVIPYLPHLTIDDEDSLSPEDHEPPSDAVQLHIVVIQLPYLSNFTDLAAFKLFSGIKLTFAATAAEYTKAAAAFGKPDMVIIPGTKNTLAALAFLRSGGLDRIVLDRAAEHVPVIGICGGYQLLCQELSDPDGTEDGTAGVRVPGLGLLPGKTVFGAEKTRKCVTGTIPALSGYFQILSGLAYHGYEIHQGITADAGSGFPGSVSQNVLGTYIHGFFDSDEIVTALVAGLCRRRSIAVLNRSADSYESVRQNEYDRLAAAVRASLDMNAIYELLRKQGLARLQGKAGGGN
jgi:adenosylcobyric acid synthase